jgi:hypothetical protein
MSAAVCTGPEYAYRRVTCPDAARQGSPALPTRDLHAETFAIKGILWDLLVNDGAPGGSPPKRESLTWGIHKQV